MSLGRRQHALISAAAGDLVNPPSRLIETFGPKGAVTGAYARVGSELVSVSCGVLRRLRKRGMYVAGQITDAGFAALEALRSRRGRRT